MFQKDLKLSQHISSKINKPNSTLGLINRTFSYIDQPTFLKLYTALESCTSTFRIWKHYLVSTFKERY